MKALLVLALVLAPSILGHSWIHCTKYNGDIFDTRGFDQSRCQGYPRGWSVNGAKGDFGQETGPTNFILNDFRNGRNPNVNLCTVPKGSRNSYSDRFPMAEYRVGERVNIIWPAKNHGGPRSNGMNCNANHGDPRDLIYAFCGTTTDPDIDSLLENRANLIADLKANGGPGFKNCYNFCSNTDRSPCQGTFTIPQSLAGQTCTFIWLWELNRGEFYTSCWEAEIAGNAGGSTTRPATTAAPATTVAPPAGGQPRADGRCGAQGANAPCPANQCCSQFGYCGVGAAYCTNSQAPATPAPPRADGRCGPTNGGAACAAGQCCSQFGFCGVGPAYCSRSVGGEAPASSSSLTLVLVGCAAVVGLVAVGAAMVVLRRRARMHADSFVAMPAAPL